MKADVVWLSQLGTLDGRAVFPWYLVGGWEWTELLIVDLQRRGSLEVVGLEGPTRIELSPKAVWEDGGTRGNERTHKSAGEKGSRLACWYGGSRGDDERTDERRELTR